MLKFIKKVEMYARISLQKYAHMNLGKIISHGFVNMFPVIYNLIYVTLTFQTFLLHTQFSSIDKLTDVSYKLPCKE